MLYHSLAYPKWKERVISLPTGQCDIPGCSLKFLLKASRPLYEVWSGARILTKKTMILIGCIGCIWGVPGVYGRYLCLSGVYVSNLLLGFGVGVYLGCIWGVSGGYARYSSLLGVYAGNLPLLLFNLQHSPSDSRLSLW